MFPKLISGPITRYGEVKDSLYNRTFTMQGLEDGMKLFVLGLAAKVLLADRVGILWHEVQVTGFESISTPLAWLAAIAYSMEIYFDFSGYSLMAMGLGRMLGIELPRNFRRPYMARGSGILPQMAYDTGAMVLPVCLYSAGRQQTRGTLHDF